MNGKFRFLAAALLVLLVTLLISQTALASSGAPVISAQQTAPQGTDIGRWGFGWIGLALINAGIAQGKNRKGLNWFLISLILGPIATFLLVVFFKKLPSVVTP